MDGLGAYQVPVVPTRITSDMDGVEGVVLAAGELGFPVAVKVLSQDIGDHKAAMGGVALDLDTPEAVREAAMAVVGRVRRHSPGARIQGFVVQHMARRVRAHKLYLEAATDPVFGPILRLGLADAGPEAKERETALPPLNMTLAQAVLTRNNLHKLLQGDHTMPAADQDAICLTLCKLSQLVIDIPEIHELEIDPLYADQEGVLALTARVYVARCDVEGADLLAIRPYPRELEECVGLKGGLRVTLRPIRPEDEPAHWEFIEAMSPEDRRLRFFGNVGQLPRSEMIKLTQIDYNREMAFLAVAERKDCEALGVAISPDAPEEAVASGQLTLGVVRAMFTPDNASAEFAVALRSDLKRQGLGRILMEKIIRYARERGTRRIVGEALTENAGMIGLARAVGFDVTKNFDDDTYSFKLDLHPRD
jgi:acetyltransferase